MKLHRTLLSGSKKWIVCAALGITSVSYSVHPQTNTADKKPATNPPPAAVVPPPQAVFLIPHNAREGMRDPFYPKSTRIFDHAPVQIATPTQVVVHVELKLQGMSGTPTHRLPIINGRTFEVGEEAEVPTVGGKVSVRCIEIRGDAVIVQANGERYELKLRSGL